MSDFDALGFQPHQASSNFDAIGFVPHGSSETSDISKLADISSQKDFLGGKFSDTGRPGAAPGEFLDSIAGAPVRSGLMALAQNKGMGGAIQAGANQFGKDPQSAPTGVDVSSQMGVQNPYAGAALSTAIDVGAQLPIMEGAVAGSRLLREVGPALQGAVESGSKSVGDMATGFGKKFGKVFASVPEDTTARYIQDPHTINSAPEREAIADDLLTRKKSADDALSKAQEDLSNAKTSLTENKSDARSGLQDQKFQSRQDLSEAQNAFSEKKQAFKEALKSNNLTSMAGEVNGAVQDLATKVSQGSSEGFDILGKSKATTSIDPLVSSLQKDIDSLRINGVPKGQGEAQAIEALRAEQMRLFNMTKSTDGKLTMPQAKEMLQSIDQRTTYPAQVGDLSSNFTNGALKNVRGQLNADVRVKVPEYATHMDQNVAPQTALLKTTSNLYGTPEKAISNLNRIDSERGQALHAPILKALGRETGRDLSTPIEHYLINQKILSTPSLFEKAIEDLPEAKVLRSAQSKAQTLADPEYSRSLIEGSSEPLSKKINQAELSVEALKDKTKLFSGITADSVTGKTKALGGANTYGAEDRFGKIDKALGTNFEKQIQARNDLDQFSKADTHGSRKTVLGSIVGLGVGAMIGHPILGAEAGGATAHALDKFSGQVFKSMLDKGMSAGHATKAAAEAIAKALSTQPVLDAIAKKDPAAIDRAILGVIREGKLPTGASAAQNDKEESPQPKGGPTKWATDGLKKLIDHSGDKSLNDKKSSLMSDQKTKNLLIAASDLKPGTKAMANVWAKVKTQIVKDGK